jgi:hypothetical protein
LGSSEIPVSSFEMATTAAPCLATNGSTRSRTSSSPVTEFFFISYVLIAAFVVLNLVIGIVLSAMEESRAESAAESSKDTSAPPVAKRLNDARVLLDGIARDLQSDDRETQPTHEEQRD